MIIRALDSRMSSISQHISTDFFRENEHHIWCNKHSFQLETTYRTFQCAVPNTEVSLFLYRSHGQSKYAVYHSDSAQDVSLVRFHGVLALLSDSFPFTVRWVYTSASCSYSFFKVRERHIFSSHSLFGNFFEFAPKFFRNFFRVSSKLLFSCYG